MKRIFPRFLPCEIAVISGSLILFGTILWAWTGPTASPPNGEPGSLIWLQSATPGTAQTGHFNISGTAIAGTFSGSGVSLTSLNATNLSSGTVGTARLGSGVADATTFLRGDSTWAAPPTPTNVPHNCTRRTSTIPSGQNNTSVNCVLGEIVTGGGGSCGTAGTVLRDSYPFDSDTWSIYYNSNCTPLTAYAICCQYP